MRRRPTTPCAAARKTHRARRSFSPTASPAMAPTARAEPRISRRSPAIRSRSTPSSLINLVLNGAEPLVVKGTPDAYRMPQYRVQLTDDEIAEVLTFVRSAWGNGAASVTADQVKALRPVTDPSSDRVIILKMR